MRPHIFIDEARQDTRVVLGFADRLQRVALTTGRRDLSSPIAGRDDLDPWSCTPRQDALICSGRMTWPTPHLVRHRPAEHALTVPVTYSLQDMRITCV